DIAEDNLHEAKRNVTVRCAVRRMVLTFLVGVPVCYLRYRPEPQSTSHARCPVEPFALAASSISARCRAMRTFREYGLRAAHTGMCADAFWRIAKRERKSRLKCDISEKPACNAMSQIRPSIKVSAVRSVNACFNRSSVRYAVKDVPDDSSNRWR